MSKPDAPKLVTALFTFKGTNNDELCFRKGDVITITQTDDGGWWEGTLNDQTAWFPSNYVKECRAPDAGHSVKSSSEKSSQEFPSIHSRVNRDIVLKDLVDSERANVAEIQGIVNNFLQPLESINLLTKEEYKQLIGNIREVVEIHQRLLANLEATVTQGAEARVGSVFLTLASKLQSVHLRYCNGHPYAVCIMDRYRDELNDFMERSGAVTPGILVLTTGLSKPFRRLEKYGAILQELERHTEKNHFDRGDTQRSICVYREIAEQCNYTRKQRELALQVLTSGIKGWEGEELDALGEILYVGPVAIAVGADRRDRYFVLFPTTLLMLSTSSRMSSFIYEGKLPLTGIDITLIDDPEDSKIAFEISGPFIESITVLCNNREERQQWIDLLSQDHSSSGLLRSPTILHVSYRSHPYSRLSRFYAKLVRKKIIHPELVKKLLYSQYVYMPDFTDVKMRKCTVTYVIYPRHSDDSEDENSARLQMPEMKQRVMLKSSVMLDVSYASRNDVGKYPAHSPLARTLSSLGNLGSSISKSRIFQNHHSLSGEFSSTSRVTNLQHLRCRNVVLATIPFSSSNEISKEYSKVEPYSLLSNWESLKPRIISTTSTKSSDFIHIGRFPLQLTTIRENAGLLNDTLETLSLPVTSVHSSDSGMADSCHMTSSELNYRCYARGRNKYAERAQMSHSESENDENKFEHQCICTSPFDSTPRQSHQSAESIQNMFKIYTSMSGTIDPKFKRIDEGYMRFLSNNDEDGRENLELLQIDENINRGGDENKDDEDCSKENTLPAKNEMDKTRFTTPILLEHQNISNKHGKIHRYPNAISVGQVHTAPVYTSGLYAHWWLKKTIPIDEGTKQGKLPWHGCYSFLVFKFRTTHFLKYSSSSIECDLFMIAYPTDIALLIEN